MKLYICLLSLFLEPTNVVNEADFCQFKQFESYHKLNEVREHITNKENITNDQKE